MLPAMETPLKDVVTPDGALAFRVPAHWRETVEPDGTRAFYDGAAETGVLRVKLFTFTSQQHVDPGVARQQLEDMDPAPGQRLETLPSGASLRTHREESGGGSQRTVMHLWILAREDPPHRLRLAVFSLSVPGASALDLESRRVFREVDREVRAARIGPRAS
jgi:hypothetical protein